MSSFTCSMCNTTNQDTRTGYISGCNHYPPEKATGNKFILTFTDTSKEIKTFEQIKKLDQEYTWFEILKN